MTRAHIRALAGLIWAASVAAIAQDTPQPAAQSGAQSSPQAASQPAAPGPAQAAAPHADDKARALVQRADEIRFPRDAFQVEVAVNSTVGGQPQEERRYLVLSKGNENSIVLTLDPPAERGQNMLLKGRELWIFMPNVSQPVRLSLSQRLTGQVANGDLARANLAGDYEPVIVGSERIAGKDHHVLELTAAQRGVTYAKVKYWVRAADAYPHKAEFYSASGRLLKTCVYEQFQSLGGRIRPTRLVVTDALKAEDRSVMEYSALKPADLPDRYFTKDYLKKLE